MSEYDQLYGCIWGASLHGADYSPIAWEHNKQKIDNLPNSYENNEHLLIRPLFHVPMPNEFPNNRNRGGFYHYQMITIGAGYNGIMSLWDEWMREFNKLLKQLYWHEAVIHLRCEIQGTWDFTWKADIAPLRLSPPQVIENWTLENNHPKYSGG